MCLICKVSEEPPKTLKISISLPSSRYCRFFCSHPSTRILGVFQLDRTTDVAVSQSQTRRVSYCKDDRAMRPIHGCPEKFRESLTTPTDTFPEICNGLLFRSILRMCVQNLKFVALPVPEMIKKLGSPWIRPRSFFSKIFNGFLFGGTP